MNNQRGRISISSLIFFVALLYGMFAGYRLLSAKLLTAGIESDIKAGLYLRQGSDLTSDKARDMILEVLEKHKVSFNREDEEAVWVDIAPGTYRTKYHVEYDFEIDFLFFKKLREVTIDKTVDGE